MTRRGSTSAPGLETRFLCLALFLLLTVADTFAQRRREEPVDVTIKVNIERSTASTKGLYVQVFDFGAVVSQQFTNDNGVVTLKILPGEYRVKVSGDLIEEISSYPLQVDGLSKFQNETIQASLKQESHQTSTDTMVSVADMNVPEKARDQFEKGIEAEKKGRLAVAQQRFEKAIAIYPDYASALNQLGVLAMNLGLSAEGESYFQRAITVNDKFSPAYANLAKVRMGARKDAEALALVEKGLSADPLNTGLLALLARLKFGSGDYAAAEAAAAKVHAQPHQNFAVVHLIAAQCFEKQNDYSSAVKEYGVFLAESPESASADKVRAAMAADQARAR